MPPTSTSLTIPSTLALLPLVDNVVVFPGQLASIVIIDPVQVARLRGILAELADTTITRDQAVIIGCVPRVPGLDTAGLPQTASTLEDRSELHSFGTATRLVKLERISSIGSPASLLASAAKALTRSSGRTARTTKPAPTAEGFILLVQGLARISIDKLVPGATLSKVEVTVHDAVALEASGDVAADARLVQELKTLATELVELVVGLITTSNPPKVTALSKRLASFTTDIIPATTTANVGVLVDSVYALFSAPPTLPTLSALHLLSALAAPSPRARLETALPVWRKFKTELVDAGKRIKRIREWTLVQEMSKIRDELEAIGQGDSDSLFGRLSGKPGGSPSRAPPAGQKRITSGAPDPEGQDDDDDDDEDDVIVLTRAVKAKVWTPESKKVVLRELKKLKKTNAQGGEYGVIRNYIETLLSLPWVSPVVDAALEPTPDAIAAPGGQAISLSFINKASAQLDTDHFGMDKVKKRLLEWLVVLRLKEELALSPLATASAKVTPRIATTLVPQRAAGASPKSTTPILLLLGPPGTGKTSIAKSLAAALGKPFTRISLGGVRDEAAIRGFLRTYVGAMMGGVMVAVKRMGDREGVILLDEIDKLSSGASGSGGGGGGNPEAALLEVLDPGQNDSFVDRYLGIPFDLSKILFIATANSLDGISAPLLDRMEVIEIDGYVHEEKLQIALRYLLPAQLLSNGLASHLFSISDAVLLFLVLHYTREAGVRSLDRVIGAVVRGKVVEYSRARDAAGATSETPAGYSAVVSQQDVITFLGNEYYTTDDDREAGGEGEDVGVALGLAYMGSGNGGLLHIESLLLPGSSVLTTTGSLGPVIIESAQLAFAWVKAHAYELGFVATRGDDCFKGQSVHLHLPSGGVKKDGPSAGVAFTVALVSLMANLRVNANLAMTGEITLRGTVGAVGGIREKVLAAHRQNIKTLLLPHRNAKDVQADLPATVQAEITIVYVKSIWEALEGAFGGRLKLDPRRRAASVALLGGETRL